MTRSSMFRLGSGTVGAPYTGVYEVMVAALEPDVAVLTTVTVATSV